VFSRALSSRIRLNTYTHFGMTEGGTTGVGVRGL
jgi:hypothetical protein